MVVPYRRIGDLREVSETAKLMVLKLVNAAAKT